MRSTWWTKLVIALLATTISACAAVQAQRKAEEEKHEAVVHRMDIAHIFVTTGDIPTGKPYQVLGQLEYTEPFSADAIDSAKMKEKLKAAAYKKYPDDIDAIIKAHSDVNDAGTEVKVTAQAIKFESSADREAMHKMQEGMVASPK
jgi:5,10-methylenetetrahydrofolate reductase